MRYWLARVGLLVLLVAGTLCTFANERAVHAADADDFYRGKTIRIIVGYPPGGGFDAYARLVARFLPSALRGKPVVVVQNMPGVGSLTAAKHLYSSSAKDGTVIGVSDLAPAAPLLGLEGGDFDATKFNWIGSPNSETALMIAWHETPFATVDDAKHREFLVGNTSVRSRGSFYARVLATTLGLKLKLVLGYPGSNDTFLAMERGEVQGHPSALWSSLRTTHADWIVNRKVRLLLQYGTQKHADLPGVPFAGDLVKNTEDKAVLEAAVALLAFGRPFMLPPNVPVERVATLRRAMEAIFKDPDFRAEAAKQHLEIAPVSGSELQALVERTYASSPAVIARLRELAGGAPARR